MTVILPVLALLLFVWILVRSVGVLAEGLTDALPDIESPLLEEVERLAAAKRDALIAIQQVELDYETGKFDDADYELAKGLVSERAIKLMRALDDAGARLKYHDAIEADLAEMDTRRSLPESSEDNRLLGEVISLDIVERPLSEAARIRHRLKRAPSTCPECAAPLLPDDRFCSECGGDVASSRCTSCDAPLRSGARFCRQCGEAVREPAEDSA